MCQNKSTTRHKIFVTLREKKHVMGAVILRDMRSRFFNHGLGFIIQSLWPLVHMLAVIGISIASSRAAPYGDGPMIFFGTGLIPTLTFIYISRFMSLSVIINKQMLNFPIVKITDILFARAFLEVIAGSITLLFMWIIFVNLGANPYPNDPEQAVFAYLVTIFLAVGVGMMVGVITSFAPIFSTVYALFTIVIYFSSGSLFVIANLPDQLATPLSYNPVFQCVEWMRTAYFETYSDRLLDKEYLIYFSLGSVLTGLSAERFSRRILLDLS